MHKSKPMWLQVLEEVDSLLQVVERIDLIHFLRKKNGNSVETAELFFDFY